MKLSGRFRDMESYVSGLQDLICSKLEEVDKGKFSEDLWKREGGGGGRTRIIENGSVIEKGGVNFSSVYGDLPKEAASQLNTEGSQFGACGISLVIHPYSPKVPTVHMNVRYFETENGKSWFGGGIDLTPYYPYTDDFVYFHSVMKEACERAVPASYENFKLQCDEYFTVKHRGEMRGIGGIFFDYLKGDEGKHFELVKSVGDSFLKSYLPIVVKRKDEKFSREDKEFQLLRRGRYVEFNLIYDRGTLFGLKTGGRVESILMSLPPEVKFGYNKVPEAGTAQSEMSNYYRPSKWI